MKKFKRELNKVIQTSGEQLEKLGELSGHHHLYCAQTYVQFRNNHERDWRCICDTLNAYDGWRKNYNKTHHGKIL